MLIRFPASSSSFDKRDNDALQLGNTPLARYRKATAVDKRTSFITEHTIVFVLHGHKYLHFEDDTHMAEPGQLVILKRGIYAMSEFVAEGLNYEALLIFFTDEFVKKFLHTHQLTSNQSPATAGHLVISSNELLDGFKTQFLGYFGKTMPAMDSILQLKLQELMLLLLAGPQGQQILAFLQSIAFGQPVDLDFIVRKHLLQPLTLEELAKLSGRSLASFNRDFQQQYNSSPKKWINEQRLEHARLLLQHSSNNVSEVAMECGFENIPHFIKIFKQRFGFTPNSIRGKEPALSPVNTEPDIIPG
jgi:AraC-like DNA-binding protein